MLLEISPIDGLPLNSPTTNRFVDRAAEAGFQKKLKKIEPWTTWKNLLRDLLLFGDDYKDFEKTLISARFVDFWAKSFWKSCLSLINARFSSRILLETGLRDLESSFAAIPKNFPTDRCCVRAFHNNGSSTTHFLGGIHTHTYMHIWVRTRTEDSTTLNCLEVKGEIPTGWLRFHER